MSACTIQGVDDDTDADDDAYGGPSTSDETDAGNSNDSGGSSSNGGDSNTGGTTSGDNGGTDNGGTDNGGTAGGGTDNGGTAGGGTGGDSSTKGGAGGAAQDGDAGAAKGGDTQTGGSGGAGEAPAAEWLDCGDRDVSGAMVVDSALDDEDVTWSGTVRVSGSIAVRDLTLTIEPGTKVIFDADSQIEFADTGNVTKVIAQGTPEEPIRFCGSEGTPGHWGGLVFSETLTEDSVIANVLIADAGANEAALIVNGPLSIDRVQVRNSGADGVLASTFGLQGSELSVQGSLGSAATLESATSVTRFPLGGRFEDNAENIVRVVENIAEEPIVFHDLGIPYLQPESLTAYGEIRFEAGVEYRVGGDASIVVSAAGNGATLFADGTEEEPVVLRGAEETPGSWAGLLIQEGTVETSRLSHLLVSHAGAAETYALSVDEPITLEHVTLDDNVFGAYVGPGGLSSSSTNLRITNTGGPPLTVDPNALIAVPPESSFVGNESDWILVESGAYTVSGNVAAPDVPYRIAGSLSLHSGAVMTLTEGTTFQMAEGGVLRVGAFDEEATFIAVGTEEAPIVFQGVLEEPGSWQGIEIEAPTNESSRLSFVEIGHGGNPDGDGANLTLRRAIGVENCRFFDSEGFGILKEAADLADYTLGNSFENTALDAVGEL